MIGERQRAAGTFAVLMGAVTAFCGWMAYDTLGAFFNDMAAGAATVRLDSGAGAVAMLVPIMLGLTIFGIVAAVRAPAAGGPTGEKIIIYAAIIMLPLALAAPWGLVAWADDMLTTRGYVRCAASGRPSRFPSADFVRAPARCGVETGGG